MDIADADFFSDLVHDDNMLHFVLCVMGIIPQQIVRSNNLILKIMKLITFIKSDVTRLNWTIKTMIESQIGLRIGNTNDMLNEIPDCKIINWFGHDVPILLPHFKTMINYASNRRILVVPQFFEGMQQMMDGTEPPSISMPKDCLQYLCMCLQNTPAHWQVHSQEVDGINWLILDVKTILDTIESSAMGCVYNVRKVYVALDNSQAIFETVDGTEWKWCGEKTMAKKLEMYVFFTLVMLQQFNASCYHNWVHFYFNDIVLYQVKSIFPMKHWLRNLLAPHIRYQEVLNQAGLFSHTPNDPSSRTVFDDVLYPGMLTNWDLKKFQENTIDVVLGYFKGSTHSPMASEMNKRGFDLVDLLSHKTNKTNMDEAIDMLQKATHKFVSDVVDVNYVPSDEAVFAMFNRNVLRYLKIKPEKENQANYTNREIFVFLISRYIMHVAHLHGLEHYMTNISMSPLRLPQRVRKIYSKDSEFSEYYNRVDAINGVFGHRIYTRFRRGPTSNFDDWSTICYNFSDKQSQLLAETYIKEVRHTHSFIRDIIVKKFHTIWDDSEIDWTHDREYLTFGSQFLGTSISM